MFTKYSGAMPKNGTVMFSAPWCGPCKVMHPIIEKLPQDVVEINVDENSQLVGQYGISGVPTLIRFVNGQPVSSLSGGGHSPERLRAFIEGRI